jgi:hypothetical protein
MVPVILGRIVPIGSAYAGLLSLDTRYLADAACVMALCVGLAFLPVASLPQSQPRLSRRVFVLTSGGNRYSFSADRGARYAAAAALSIFVVSSIWSVRAYDHAATGGPAARLYLANVRQALKQLPSGTSVLDQNMPLARVGPSFGTDSRESFVIGGLAHGATAAKAHWITVASGTIDNLRIFGGDGRLYPAVMAGDYSVHRSATGFAGCWPEHKGQIVVRMQHMTSIYDQTLHFSYIWSSAPATLTLWYGNEILPLTLETGTHNAYITVSGDTTSFAVSGFGTSRLCIGGAQSGHLVPYGTPIP